MDENPTRSAEDAALIEELRRLLALTEMYVSPRHYEPGVDLAELETMNTLRNRIGRVLPQEMRFCAPPTPLTDEQQAALDAQNALLIKDAPVLIARMRAIQELS